VLLVKDQMVLGTQTFMPVQLRVLIRQDLTKPKTWVLLLATSLINSLLLYNNNDLLLVLLPKRSRKER